MRRLSRYERDSLGTAIIVIGGAIFFPDYESIMRIGTLGQKIGVEVCRQIIIWTGIYWLVMYGITPLVGDDEE